AFDAGALPRQRLGPLRRPPWLVEALLARRKGSEHEVELQGAERLGGVGVVAGAHDREDGVGVTQRPEQPAPETLARLSSRREAGDEVDLERRMDALLRLRHLGEAIDAVVGKRRHTLGRLEAGRGADAGE